MRFARSTGNAQDGDVIIDLRERLAPYGDLVPRPGWVDEPITAEVPARTKPRRAKPLPAKHMVR